MGEKASAPVRGPSRPGSGEQVGAGDLRDEGLISDIGTIDPRRGICPAPGGARGRPPTPVAVKIVARRLRDQSPPIR